MTRSSLLFLNVAFVALLVLPSQVSAQSDVVTVDDDPYSKTFEDFQWDESEERVAIPGALPLGAKIPTTRLIRNFERRVSINAEDSISWAILGHLYLRHAKESDDLPAYDEAIQALEKSLQLNAKSAATKLNLAEAYNAKHRFADGLRLASEVYESNSHSSAALAIVSDCQIELGRYKDAGTSLDTLVTLEDSPPILARLAHYAELNGEQATAVSLLDKAISDYESLGATANDTLWYLWRKGTLTAAQGKFAEAVSIYQRVLKIDPEDAATLMSLADAQHALGDTTAAIETTNRLVSLHQPPPAMALLGDLYAAIGKPDLAEQWLQKAEAAMRQEQVTAGDAHARELAMFLADHDRHLSEALELATKDFGRRQDIYSYDALAWCQFKVGELEKASENIKLALQLGTQDAMLFEHAGAIAAAMGQADKAADWLARAAKLKPRQ